MTAMPAALASAGPAKSTSAPFTRSVPVSGRCTPASILTIVDLPAPFSPTRACASPPYSGKLTPCTAATAPKDFVTSWTSSRAVASATSHLPEQRLKCFTKVGGPRHTCQGTGWQQHRNADVAQVGDTVRCCFNVSTGGSGAERQDAVREGRGRGRRRLARHGLKRHEPPRSGQRAH